MNFSIEKSIQILEKTPQLLTILLDNISEEWTLNNEGNQSWSAFDVVGHLIHCDESNWIPRIEITLSDAVVVKFEPLDRFAQIDKNKNKTLLQLLNEFVKIRFSSITKLRSLNITEEQLMKKAIHPDLGEVNLSQLIATWVVHDLAHMNQISRVMAKQYKEEVGPWVDYLRILQ
ncbi:DinB family protein [Flavobacterium sp. ARAG 55.4]|uniref:DinB family protein n=1 Tax=Flavobacterium sp. ARAG 55.4 TaxID=3451357 RepID=UPI003F445665